MRSCWSGAFNTIGVDLHTPNDVNVQYRCVALRLSFDGPPAVVRRVDAITFGLEFKNFAVAVRFYPWNHVSPPFCVFFGACVCKSSGIPAMVLLSASRSSPFCRAWLPRALFFGHHPFCLRPQ